MPPAKRPPRLALTAVQLATRSNARRAGLAWLVQDGLDAAALLPQDAARRNAIRAEVRQAMRELREEDGVERMAEEIRVLRATVTELTRALAGDSGSPYMGEAPTPAGDPASH